MPLLSRHAATRRNSPRDAQEVVMLDVVMLGLGLGFFVLSVGYAYACERL